MKKRILLITLAMILCFAMVGCGGGSPEGDDSGSQEKETVYGVGDTWEVDGQWKLTVDSVTVTSERNEYADTNPAQVIIINYTYENLGYEDEDGIMDGLYIDFESGQIVDSGGKMGSSYPAVEAINYPQETPVGAACTAQSAIGLENEGNSVKIILTEYDGKGAEHKATFELAY